MEYTLKTDLEIGQTLYYLDSKDKTVYAPCVACNNERKIKVSAGGENFTVDCPKCTGKQVKGDMSRSKTVKVYTVEDTEIKGFIYGRDSKWHISHSMYPNFNPETLRAENGKQYYTDKSAAESMRKELNKQEKKKADDFLAGL